MNMILEETCQTCQFFVKLTEKEKRYLSKFDYYLLKNYALSMDEFIGVCLGHQKRYPNFLLQGLILDNEFSCTHYMKGCYSEILCDLSLSYGLDDILIIRYQNENNETEIKFCCDRNGECNSNCSLITLNIPCRFCGAPLIIKGGNILKCFCTNCGISIDIPISMRFWPGLVLPKGGCVHNEHKTHCEFCDKSRLTKTNLLNIEIPILIKNDSFFLANKASSQNTNFRPKQADSPFIDDHAYYSYEEEYYYERLDNKLFDEYEGFENYLEYYSDIIEEYEDYKDLRDEI